MTVAQSRLYDKVVRLGKVTVGGNKRLLVKKLVALGLVDADFALEKDLRGLTWKITVTRKTK